MGVLFDLLIRSALLFSAFLAGVSAWLLISHGHWSTGLPFIVVALGATVKGLWPKRRDANSAAIVDE